MIILSFKVLSLVMAALMIAWMIAERRGHDRPALWLLRAAALVFAAICVLCQLAGCDTADLETSSAPPLPRPAAPRETTSADCDRLGGTWLPNALVAVGGTCTFDPPPAPATLPFGLRDAGTDAQSQGE